MSNQCLSRTLTAAILCGAVALGSCATTPESGSTPSTTACPRIGTGSDADLTTTRGWIAHLAAHPDDTALVIIPDAATPDGTGTVRKKADTPLDVASAAKIIHLLAYADAVADGTLRPDTQVPVAEWEAFYLPLDGGAHAAALDRLGIDSREPSPGVAVASDPDATVALDDLVSAMIVESDNAAADWLAEELGSDTLETVAADAGWRNPRTPNYLGSMLAILEPDVADDPAAASRRFREDPEWAADILRRTPGGYAVQRDILRGTATATAGELAAVYTELATGGGGTAGDVAPPPGAHRPRRVHRDRAQGRQPAGGAGRRHGDPTRGRDRGSGRPDHQRRARRRKRRCSACLRLAGPDAAGGRQSGGARPANVWRMTEAQELADLRRRVTDLESRVRKLENPGTPEAPPTDGEGAISGTVRYSGELTVPDQLRWTITLDADAARVLPRDRIADILTAVSSPARIHILQELLAGPATSKKLQEILGYSSPGPLYHHLKPLQAAGIVERDTDGRNHIPASRVVPLLILMATAGDIAGEFNVTTTGRR
ncbi:serine hydrolase [Corynebacterium meridianum]|uniref:Serine hydrolase n=1 Tax=Corynebacterium meridianum TaxID=2765363 RepID=A0A934I4J0_9CORY|nr:serine hydrolase [Corynebacterium meridianum]MBI8990056.1 serine hydrolase [Corynebacterium meridianum]